MGGGLCETHEAPAGDRAVDTLENYSFSAYLLPSFE